MNKRGESLQVRKEETLEEEELQKKKKKKPGGESGKFVCLI